MFDLLTDYTFQTVLLGTMMIGAVSGALGCFAYLRRQSLIGDVVSHSSLFGVMLFFLASYALTGEGSKSLVVLIPGAIAAGTAALLLTRTLVRRTRLKEDSGLGVMLALFFGAGIVLLRWVQRTDPAIPGRRGLQDYLFGMAAAMTQDDLWMIATLGGLAVLVMLLLWKELKLFTFDPVFSHSLGYRSTLLDTLLIMILVVGIVIGIQSVGVVLMIALLVTPASAARQWTRQLGTMVMLAALMGAVCGLIGSVASALYANVPTGPVIVLSATLIFVVSLLFAPRRGVVSRIGRRRKLIASQAVASSGRSAP
ncbi:MAG: metal ABC transporter permease [Mariniblastus sp.]|nr:metal ABC transporter permease [Mariniblastus sp.]